MILTIDNFLKFCYNNDVRLSGIASQSIAKIWGVSSATLFFCTVFSRYLLELLALLRIIGGVYKNALFFVS
nr:MAG TPA: hypothetical protein [Caudoviricetes sp.]